jgi:cell division protein ZapA
MANVAVTVNGRTYDLTCNDGQEPHLRELAAEIAGRVDELVKTIGQAGEARLLLMVGLLLADELADANAEIDRLQREQGRAPAVDEAAIATSLEKLAKQIHDIAARVEAA